MKRLVNFKFDPDGRWATLSGVLMGIAFFAQAFDYLWLRALQGVPFFQLLVMLILPLLLEGIWCVSLRAVRLGRVEVYGIFGAVFCFVLLLQTFFYHSVFLTVIFIVLFLIAGAAMVLITWGFLSHRALGLLIFLALAAIRILFVVLHRFAGGQDWAGFLNDLPSICVLLSLMAFFGDVRLQETY